MVSENKRIFMVTSTTNISFASKKEVKIKKMETKVKKFSKKLLALFLAVVMAVGCFTSVVSVYGASKDPG